MNTHDALLSLDRMAIEEAGPNPSCIAQAVITQLELVSGSMPIERIAYALDIKEIRYEPLNSFEGMLLTPFNRSKGSILINSSSPLERQRFTLAHELGHYLNTTHKPAGQVGFLCAKSDMKVFSDPKRKLLTQHQRQELEANRFAIELLAPKKLLGQYLRVEPDLTIIGKMRTELKLSSEASARRYIELHDEPLAIAFTKDKKIRYVTSNRDEIKPCVWLGDSAPVLPSANLTNKITEFEETASSDWFSKSPSSKVFVQTRYQQNGYAMSLITFDDDEIGEDENNYAY